MKIFVTDPQGKEHELEALEGWRVMEIIKDYGLPLKAECGGACCCATCHVYVSEEWGAGWVEGDNRAGDGNLNAKAVTDLNARAFWV